jgi:O-acetyl-ADP-ribose deacetylase (regulator of RNase III)
MLSYVKGNLFLSPARVLVNTVNTVGVMGKGLAKQFKGISPSMFREYKRMCDEGEMTIGKSMLYKTPNKWILNFPTKEHWNRPSRIEYIEEGLREFRRTYSAKGIESIAFPPLGCGQGGLNFREDVQPLMEKYLGDLPIQVFIYPSTGSMHTTENIDDRTLREWLTRESCRITFDDVWEDVGAVIQRRKGRFRTPRMGNEFEAVFNQGERAVRIRSSGHTYLISYENLYDVWRQLRVFGFVGRSHSPVELDSELSYIVPVLAELPYIATVRLARDLESLDRSDPVGVQFIPYHIDRFNCGGLASTS